MSFRLIVIILATATVTVILMNNAGDMDFWLFGETRLNKLAVMGSFLFAGILIGFLLSRPRQRQQSYEEEGFEDTPADSVRRLSDEDREYIS